MTVRAGMQCMFILNSQLPCIRACIKKCLHG
nr:MAG TPA: hypothetical protein [Caudoviricetes sp.]